MVLSKPSISEHGIATVRHHFDFDALVDEARRAGLDVHPCIIARNWAPACRVNVQSSPSVFTVFSMGFDRRVDLETVIGKLQAEGLRPCTPHEAVAFAIDKRDVLDRETFHVALGQVWHAPDGPAVINVWHNLGSVRVGTSPCEGTWNGRGGWRFLATFQR